VVGGAAVREKQILLLDGDSLSLGKMLEHLSQPDSAIELADEAWGRIEESWAHFCAAHAASDRVYGLNTGFGDLVEYEIPEEEIDAMQKRLVLSHAVGVGAALPELFSRTTLLLRLNCLAKGASGIRAETVRYLLNLYNHSAYPEIYSLGSLGASGDLAPLSHLAAFAMGEGWGFLRGKRRRADAIRQKLGMAPIRLLRKEGLSLINGTSAMVAVGLHGLSLLADCLKAFLAASAMLTDALGMRCDFLSKEAYALKPHPGARWVVDYLVALRAPLGRNREEAPWPFQISYSFRCLPFVLGTMVESLQMAVRTLEIEANSANDNPLFLRDTETTFHGGHFHGHPVSVVLDQTRVAAVHLSALADRQLEFAFDRKRHKVLRAFMSAAPEKGYCGLEGAQYLATSLVAENRMLAAPFSPQSIPTNAGNQDYVSMGLQSALATTEMGHKTLYVLGVYLLAVGQAYALRDSVRPSGVFADVLDLLHGSDLPYRDDKVLAQVIEQLAARQTIQQIVALIESSAEGLPCLLPS